MTEFDDVVKALHLTKDDPPKTFILNVTHRIDIQFEYDHCMHQLKGWVISSRHVLFRHPMTAQPHVAIYCDKSGLPYAVVRSSCTWIPNLSNMQCDIRDIYKIWGYE